MRKPQIFTITEDGVTDEYYRVSEIDKYIKVKNVINREKIKELNTIIRKLKKSIYGNNILTKRLNSLKTRR